VEPTARFAVALKDPAGLSQTHRAVQVENRLQGGSVPHQRRFPCLFYPIETTGFSAVLIF